MDDTMVLETTFAHATGGPVTLDRRTRGRAERTWTRVSVPRRGRGRAAAGPAASRGRDRAGAGVRATGPSTGSICAAAACRSEGGITVRGGADVLALCVAGAARQPTSSRARAAFTVGAGGDAVVRARAQDVVARPAGLAAGDRRASTTPPRRGGPGRGCTRRTRGHGRPRAPERAGPVRADLLADRGDLRRADDVAARDTQRLSELGLPLRMGAGRELHHPSPVGGRVPRRGRQVLRLHDRGRSVTGGRGADLQIMFGVGGEHDLTERELPHLSGWRDSAPVRIGNGAWNQRQLDVYGELLDAAYRLPDQLDPSARPRGSSSPTSRTPPPPAGTKRTRGSGKCGRAEHFLYSKLMCWVALDRASSSPTVRCDRSRRRWKGVRKRSRTRS